MKSGRTFLAGFLVLMCGCLKAPERPKVVYTGKAFLFKPTPKIEDLSGKIVKGHKKVYLYGLVEHATGFEAIVEKAKR